MFYKGIKGLFAAAFVCISVGMTAAQIQASAMPQQEEVQDELLEENGKLREKAGKVLPAPKTVTQDKVAYHAVTISWEAVEGAAGYQIEYAAGDENFTVAATTEADVLTYQCKGLLTGTKYQLRVCALDENGTAGDYVLTEAEPYLNKTKFTSVSTPQMAKVVLEWKKVAGAMNYELYRKTSKQDAYELLGVTTELTYTDTKVTAGESYSYQVRATRDVNGTTVQAKFSAAAKAALTAAAMQLESCEAVGDHSVKLTWKQDTAVSGYYIYRSVKENGTFRKIKTISKNATLTYTDTKLVPGKKFYYKICTYTKGTDGTVRTGELSPALKAQPQAEAPLLSAVHTNLSNRSLSLEWKKVANASGYRVYRSVYPDKGFAKIKDLSGGMFVGYEDRNVIPGGTYYYRVKALYVSGSYKGLSLPSISMEGSVAWRRRSALRLCRLGRQSFRSAGNCRSEPGATSCTVRTRRMQNIAVLPKTCQKLPIRIHRSGRERLIITAYPGSERLAKG